MNDSSNDSVRLDKWLWAARFFKTRRLAVEAIDGGKVKVDGVRAKPAKAIKPGAELSIRKGPYEHVVHVLGLSERRGPAKEAQALYAETPESVERREALAAELKASSVPVPDSRPNKRDRRRLAEFKQRGRGDSG